MINMRSEQPFFRADWKSVVLTAVLLPMLLMLGFWQLSRGEEKRELLAQFEARRQLAPVPLAQLQDVEEFRPVAISGHFDQQRYWLLDNRIRHGRFGFEVVALFALEDGGAVLVNRGWVPGDASRRSLPTVAIPSGRLQLRGEIYRGSGRGFELGTTPANEGWPRLQQWLDVEAVRAEFGAQVKPFIVRLFAGEPGAYTVEHAVVNMQPQRHTGYAVQWFAMAAALVLLFLARNTTLFSRTAVRADSNREQDSKRDQ